MPRAWQTADVGGDRHTLAMLEKGLSDGVALRLLEEADAQELYELVDANREYLSQWMAWPRAQTAAGTLDWIRITRRQLAGNAGLNTALIIDGQIAGTVGVHGISWQDETTSIGYWLAERFQGRGAMTTAVRAYTRHAFDVWGLHRMELQAAVGNAPSRAIAERLGFVNEGVRRQAEKIEDRRLDIVMYAALAGEWAG